VHYAFIAYEDPTQLKSKEQSNSYSDIVSRGHIFVLFTSIFPVHHLPDVVQVIWPDILVLQQKKMKTALALNSIRSTNKLGLPQKSTTKIKFKFVDQNNTVKFHDVRLSQV
jgi:hypothetical protein